MADLSAISVETLDTIKKATTEGVNIGTGISGVDLSGVISLVPVNTPFYDHLPKTKPAMGAPFAQWKALLNVNDGQQNPATPFDHSAPLALLDEVDVSALYARTGYGYTVTQDSIDAAGGYADAKAIGVFNTLNQYKIGMDKKLLGGQSFALNVPTGLALGAASTGGQIAASTTVEVQVAARTGSGYYWGGSTPACAAVGLETAAGTATNSILATVEAVWGAVAYDWFVGGLYYTTTVVNTVEITSIPTANASVPKLPGLYRVAPATVPTVDASAGEYDFNGLLATLTGDYAVGGAFGQVTKGNGQASGAALQSLDGKPLSVNGGNINEIDDLLQEIYDNVELSPDVLMMSSTTASGLSSALVTTAAGATTMFAPNNVAEREGVVAGAFISWYINKAAGGTAVRIDVQPHMVPGHIIARTDSVPFPNSNITNTLEQRDRAPIADYEYASARIPGQAGGGPRYDGETYSVSTLVNRAPVSMGVLSNIGVAAA